MDYRDVKEIAKEWGVSERRVTYLCNDGRIDGAQKINRKWLIPKNVDKPDDLRSNTILYTSAKPFPIGVSDYINASQNYYYVDKTLLIKEVVDSRTLVTLFTRPRRFGKTLNMDMLRVFFEKTEHDNSIYFKDKLVWKEGKSYQEYQGKYPVIFLTFKDVKYKTWNETKENFAALLALEFARHSELANTTKCLPYEIDCYKKIVDGNASNMELSIALSILSSMLKKHFGIAPIIIIDEYDTPIQTGFSEGFYEDVISFMINLFSGAFKDNSNITFGFLTGILRVGKESIFSGLNNLKVRSILDEKCSEYFGFTKSEVEQIAVSYSKVDKLPEISSWYDGYKFGSTEIFNPWSVLNYFDDECQPKAFWQATGSNSVISEIISVANDDIRGTLQELMSGGTISTFVDTEVVYPEIKKNPYSIYSFLLVAGYLTVRNYKVLNDDRAIYELAIPNKEIYFVYEKEILSALSYFIPSSTAMDIQRGVISQDISLLQTSLEMFLKQSISFYDSAKESFYHGLILGLTAIMTNLYKVTSNREAGDGRFDIQLLPYDKKLPGIIIEVKVKDTPENLEKLAADALKQIKEKGYFQELQNNGITKVLELGIAFCRKQTEIASDFVMI